MAMRFGLLGTGYWASETHAPALAAAPEAVLAGVWGRDPGRAEALADRHGVRAYQDVDELLADVDAVSISLPPEVQQPLALRAAEAGKHLLLEKPVGLSAAGAAAVADAVSAAGVASVVFFTNRFAPAVEATIQDAAARGGWDGGRATILASIFEPGSPYAASDWRRTHGALWDLGPHILSVLVPVLGEVTEVTAMSGPHSTSHMLLRHQGGAVSTVTLSLDAPPAANALDIAFVGDAGVLTVPVGETSAVTALTTAIGRLARSASTGAPDPCDTAFAARINAVLEAAQRSMGSAVKVTPAG
ncbi:Gfo/Idh/MocA family protein [Actinomadura rupiterrae]|uniref:Gfo/Idh/MocA family protein n=1 Tax=Actinomadura rupiterrae TaxID=559627 RepID=UPI0020A3020C|nr:Gfo/Idh/MocA family oxidoreductase [Actinomadura rupiterrae]MCP2341379.1 putative dehydrogenase [Actinomadura rupiterrae]